MPEGQLFTVAALEGDQHWSPTDSTDSTMYNCVRISVSNSYNFSPSVVEQKIKRKIRAYIDTDIRKDDIWKSSTELKEIQMWIKMYDKFFISIFLINCLAC